MQIQYEENFLDVKFGTKISEVLGDEINRKKAIAARFNNEIWGVPEFHAASDLLEGRLFSCHVEGVDEEKKRFKSATLTLIRPEDIEDPSEFLLGEIKKVHDILGGNVVKFNGSRKSVKFEIYDE